MIRRPWNQNKRFAASIPVDEVRRLRSFLSLAAEETAWRVVIVDSADELAGPAANALLKSLEEPPAPIDLLAGFIRTRPLTANHSFALPADDRTGKLGPEDPLCTLPLVMHSVLPTRTRSMKINGRG